MSAPELLSNDKVAATEVPAPAAIVIIDEAGRIHASNNAMQTMFGYTSAALALRSIDDLLVEQGGRSAASGDLCRAVDAVPGRGSTLIVGRSMHPATYMPLEVTP